MTQAARQIGENPNTVIRRATKEWLAPRQAARAGSASMAGTLICGLMSGPEVGTAREADFFAGLSHGMSAYNI